MRPSFFNVATAAFTFILLELETMSKLSMSEFCGDYFFRVPGGTGVVAMYDTCEKCLRIKKDCPEMGIYEAVCLPYIFVLALEGGMKRVTYLSEHGFAPAEDVNPVNPCAKCVWATGERLLPCTVNPMSYGTPCRDYEI